MFGIKPNGLGADDKRDDKAKTKPYPKRKTKFDETKDWRNNENWEIKNQGSCGSCWTFSAIGSITGNCGIKTGKWYDLSEQELVDCATSPSYFECNGCGGGWMSWALEYVYDKEGSVRTSKYPYKASNGVCNQLPKSDRYCKPSSVLHLPRGSYDDLINALDDGPVAVGVNASPWHFYTGESVLSAKDCTGPMSAVNHGVVAVGWGTSKEGVDYWLLRNSWGPRWGISGFI